MHVIQKREGMLGNMRERRRQYNTAGQFERKNSHNANLTVRVCKVNHKEQSVIAALISHTMLAVANS